MKKPLIVTLWCDGFFIFMLRCLMQRIKASSNALCVVYAVYVDTVDTKIKTCNALNAMYVDTVDTAICGFYTTLYTV